MPNSEIINVATPDTNNTDSQFIVPYKVENIEEVLGMFFETCKVVEERRSPRGISKLIIGSGGNTDAYKKTGWKTLDIDPVENADYILDANYMSEVILLNSQDIIYYENVSFASDESESSGVYPRRIISESAYALKLNGKLIINTVIEFSNGKEGSELLSKNSIKLEPFLKELVKKGFQPIAKCSHWNNSNSTTKWPKYCSALIVAEKTEERVYVVPDSLVHITTQKKINEIVEKIETWNNPKVKDFINLLLKNINTFNEKLQAIENDILIMSFLDQISKDYCVNAIDAQKKLNLDTLSMQKTYIKTKQRLNSESLLLEKVATNYLVSHLVKTYTSLREKIDDNAGKIRNDPIPEDKGMDLLSNNEFKLQKNYSLIRMHRFRSRSIRTIIPCKNYLQLKSEFQTERKDTCFITFDPNDPSVSDITFRRMLNSRILNFLNI